ncbi:MAG: dihydroneopterin aldolase [Glomeribacter sp. 1016415]|nr:dihydroneopterin aldolase [Glomeribacter sp. 1016415]
MLNSLTDAQRADCRRLFLRDYVIQLLIGVHPFEKKSPQRVVVNVELWVPLTASTPAMDALSEVVDYNLMRDTIASYANGKHIHLLETLCDDAAKRMLAHPHVRAVRVCAEKPDIYPDCAAVGVEVFRCKEVVK